MGEFVYIHDLHVFSVVLLVLVKMLQVQFCKNAYILSLRSLFHHIQMTRIETQQLFTPPHISVLTFGSYEIYKQALLNKFPNTKPAFIYAISAILGDVTGSGWLCPSEVMKQQLQAGIYPSMSEAIKGIWSKSGIGGFYQGFTGGLSRDVPFRVAQLTTFEVTKSLYLNAKKRRSGGGGGDDTASLSAVEAAICGAAAGSFSAAITNPLDRIKTLMMTDVSNAYGGSVMACASKIVKDEGIQGLFAGVVPRVGYIAPSVCIFFVTYEFAQQKMQKREREGDLKS